jgi:hypothetical protein
MIGTKFGPTHASCRAVAHNAMYRDFGTTRIPATLTFGAKTGFTPCTTRNPKRYLLQPQKPKDTM